MKKKLHGNYFKRDTGLKIEGELERRQSAALSNKDEAINKHTK